MDFNLVDIEEDLSGRDFTINAIAWSPRPGLIDLHG
jgi:tRNA nucleotidyltransferase/poly(A) polymerase